MTDALMVDQAAEEAKARAHAGVRIVAAADPDLDGRCGLLTLSFRHSLLSAIDKYGADVIALACGMRTTGVCSAVLDPILLRTARRLARWLDAATEEERASLARRWSDVDAARVGPFPDLPSAYTKKRGTIATGRPRELGRSRRGRNTRAGAVATG